MSWVFGAYTLPSDEIVSDKSPGDFVAASSPRRWAEYDCVGATTTIMTYLGRSSPEFTLTLFCSLATVNALEALDDDSFTFKTPWDTTGFSVVIKQMTSRFTAQGELIEASKRYTVELTLKRR
ncbi:MAG: hypothetical protein Q8R28_01300 [Dehalococcoidia bacterium]|nr:hypothetical protein [Dehalococcoidia bacterium]